MKKLRILGISQGQGALLFPFRKRQIVANIEPRGVFHTPGEEQWKLNFGDIPFLKEYQHFEDIDIIVGSPNCGHSSILSYSRKKTLGNPKADKSLNMFIHGVQDCQPKIFLMENLPKLLDLFPIKEWEETFPNYNLIFHCHPVSVFGNSQTSRKRALIIGVRKDQSRVYLNNLKRIFLVNTPKVSRELLKLSLEEELSDYNNLWNLPNDKKLAMYDYRDKSKKTLTVEQVHDLWNKDFKDEYKWPIKSSKMNTLPGVYRLHPDRYPLTVRPSDRQFHYCGWPLSLMDYKVIQGFPYKFKLYMDMNNRIYWLNKGRVTLTKGPSYEIGEWFKKALRNSNSELRNFERVDLD